MIANGEDQVKFVNSVLDKIEDFVGECDPASGSARRAKNSLLY